ncbi:unnamed protein product [Cyclocybe aegerita]|uniref:Uncharacterized protein n=1 Tax=Cyclocybe aegerita TaxID=1973307 RepID=A0A8S0WUD2_CYCAE|nr:unnamed protein product [Cyclocybe aegerita]
MASDAAPAAVYACRCLNVRIVVATATGSPPDYPRDAQYTPVFVNDDGISVTHPQVTVRINSKGVPIPGTSRCSRFTAVTCLFCNLPVYRVYQIISLDVEGNESVLLPTEEWVEREVLKTATGWIDVHKDCLVGDGIASAQASSSYAAVFNLYLPSRSSVPASPKLIKADEETPLKDTASPEVPTPSYLAEMRPLFLPPPFTPSHPIFVHLAAVATKESQELRATAEQRISDFIKAETAGVEMQERDIKRQVEVLWKKFRQHLVSVQQERSANNVRSPTRGKEAAPSGLLSPTTVSSSVAVRNFEPVPVSLGDITSISSSVPRRSALSESLATSGFHHPKQKQRQNSSTGEASNGYDSDRSETLSTRSGSSTLVHPVHQVDGTNILQFRRNVNDTINTEASYRYFVNLEEDITRHKRQQEEAMKKQGVARAQQDQEAGPSQVPSGPNANDKKPSRKVQIVEPQLPTAGEAKAEDKDASSRGADKGKRKVTFDVQPAVVTINGKDDKAENDESEEDPTEDAREMIFDLEDLETAVTAIVEGQTALPLLEQPAGRPSRAKKARTQTSNAMDAFSTLRPSSLPNPSHIRPIRSQPGVDSSSSQGMMLSLPRVSAAAPRNKVTHVVSSSQTPLNEQDAELLKLVAADTPSHRGAWTPDSKAWQTFTRRQDAKNGPESGKAVDDGGEAEEEASSTVSPLKVSKGKGKKILDFSEEDDDLYEQSRNYGVAASLPIEIVKRVKPREQLSLASYRPQAAVGPEQEEQASSAAPVSSSSHGNKNLSAAAVRKAAYAERDRLRSMDPGALDFANGPDEQDDDDDDDEEEPSEQKARKQALRILQARSEVPEEGMWRSLAS